MALSAPLLTRKRVIKVTIETTKGTKVAGTSAIRVFDLEINSTAPFEERKGSGLYLGNTEAGILGELSGSCSFKAELRGNGASGMDAAIAILLQACGFKKAVEVYTLSSTLSDHKTISIDVWEDGRKKGLAGASGIVTFEGEVGKRMMCNFEFFGRWVAPIDEALPAYVPGTETPLRLQAGTFTLATEAIKIAKYGLATGANVIMRGDVSAAGGIDHYMITDFDPVVSLDPEADLVAGHDYHGIWLAGTEAAVSLAIGGGALDTITIAQPKVQYRELRESDRNGIQIYDLTGQCNHDSGDDAVTITVT